MSEQASPYPLILEPILKEKVWGGRRLERLGKRLAPGAMIGESWELSDLAETSASGGGGGEARSKIRNGALAGRTIGDAARAWGRAMMGEVGLSPAGGFPLLLKFLDAREHLSVQVHPSAAYCKAHPEAHLKTECWYVLEATPGSVIYKGVKKGVTREAFARALALGQGEGVVAMLESVPAVKGECHNLPSGTVHALGAGVLIAEVQTPSDTTFRVYDWAKEYGRKGRELHVDQSMACIQFEPARDATRMAQGSSLCKHVSTGFFDVDEHAMEGWDELHLAGFGDPERPQALMVLEGAGRLLTSSAGGGGQTASTFRGADDVPLSTGDTVLVPASLTKSARFVAAGVGARVLRTIVRGT